MIRVRLDVPDGAGSLAVAGEAHHYLFRVLRLRAGDAVEVFDGKGRAFPATVEAIAAESARLSLGAPRALPLLRPIAVVQGLPKGDKLEWVIQKATELGASSIHPAACARSVTRVSASRAGAKLTRWRKIAEE